MGNCGGFGPGVFEGTVAGHSLEVTSSFSFDVQGEHRVVPGVVH